METQTCSLYLPEAPLSRDEATFLQTVEGASLQEALHSVGATLTPDDAQPRFTVQPTAASREAIEHCVWKTLVPIINSVEQQHGEQLALGAVALTFRLCYCTLGPEHDTTLRLLRAAGSHLENLGRRPEALSAYTMVHAARQQKLGAGHPDTLRALNSIGLCLYSMGEFEAALARYREGLEPWRTLEELPAPFGDWSNMALCLAALCQYASALPLFVKAYEALATRTEPNHSDTWIVLSNWASCLDYLGRHREAFAKHKQAYKGSVATLGPRDPATLLRLNNLAGCLERQADRGPRSRALRKLQAAHARYNVAFEGLTATLGAQHVQTLAVRNNLAHCLLRLEHWERACHHFAAACEGLVQQVGPHHPLTLTVRYNWGCALFATERLLDAFDQFRLAYEGQVARLGIGHYDTLKSVEALAHCLEELGDRDYALVFWRECAQALTEVPQPGGAWLDLVQLTTAALTEAARGGEFPAWTEPLQALQHAAREVLDFQDPEQVDVARAHVLQIQTTYLGLCLDLHRLDLVPEALASIQGRKLAALVREELLLAAGEQGADTPQARLQDLRRDLRRLVLGQHATSEWEVPAADGPVMDSVDLAGRRDARQAAYRHKLAEYRSLREQCERETLTVAVTTPALSPALEELQSRLGSREALVVLVQRQDHTPAELLACVMTRARAWTVPLGSQALVHAGYLTRAYELRQASRAGMRKGRIAEGAAGQGRATLRPPTLQDMAMCLHTGLWAPLKTALPAIDRLHLVTQGELHLLPYELGCPEAWTLFTYPGFIYYQLIRHQRPAGVPPAAPAAGLLGLLVHGAEETHSPIPLVHAEAALVRGIWQGRVEEPVGLDTTAPALDCLHLAGHGSHEERDPTLAYLYTGRDKHLDFHRVLESRRHPRLVVLSACTVGRTSDDPDGDPLGLMGAFFVRGADYIIAPVQAVSDFFMPLLTTLFHQAWQRLGDPHRALRDAKRRLRTGDWYDDTPARVQQAYRPVMRGVLEQVADPTRTEPVHMLALARSLGGWTLPDAVRTTYAPMLQGALTAGTTLNALHTFQRRHRTGAARQALVEATLARLLGDRERLPGGPITDLCTWVRGFGLPRDTTSEDSA